jgi:hypothetical protein
MSSIRFLRRIRSRYVATVMMAALGWKYRQKLIDKVRHSPAVDDRTAVSDTTTVTDLLAGSRSEGYDTQFQALPDGEIRCGKCSQKRAASEYSFDALRRMEGASDPDDAQAVLAVHCPACGAPGSMVLNYGPTASPEDSDVLAAMRDNRGGSKVETGTSPGEMIAHEPT